MCKIGDIILIRNAKSEHGDTLGPHPFIVIDDTNGEVSGIYQYDFIGLITSSMDTEEKHEKMLKYPGNFPLLKSEKQLLPGKINKDAFVKADQFFYFSKSKISYIQFGKVDPEIFNLIIEFIQELNKSGVPIKRILNMAEII